MAEEEREPPLTMDKDTNLLSKVAANHLFLTQFEAFRATILSLRHRNPNLALSLLQTIVVNGGNFKNAVYSTNCSSPALLTWLSSLELFQFENWTSVWSSSVSADSIRFRVEFLLYVQMISARVSESVDRVAEVEEESEEVLKELRGSMRLLDGLMELGLRRLKEDLIVDLEDEEKEELIVVREEELMCLRRVILENVDIFVSLCENIQEQVGAELEKDDDNGLAITVRREGRVGTVSSEEDQRVLKSIQKYVQIALLDEVRQCVNKENVDEAISHIRCLRLGYGVSEEEYRLVFQDLLQKVLSGIEGPGDVSRTSRDKLLYIYREALSTNCTHLVQMLQAVQDHLLLEEINMLRASDNQILPPLMQLHNRMQKKKLENVNNDTSLSSDLDITVCMRDLYHYSRVAGLHVLECVMETALSAVKNEQLEEASYVVSLFPRLQPLVSVLGWDLLSSRTAARRKLMQLLWTGQPKICQLDDSSLYENGSDEKSCIEFLCDSLCYRLDFASFVACVNSGQPWDIRSSLFLSGNGQVDFQEGNAHLDPFVENLVLERLSSQSPLRVLFDVVPTITFEDAIKLISMQPTDSTAAEWKRMQDGELIHMRYALDYAVMALGAMEKSVSDDQICYPQLSLRFLKELRHHLEAVNSVARKIFMVNIIISLLHVDSISVDFEHCGLAGSNYELSRAGQQQYDDVNFDKMGNHMAVSIVEFLLDTLRHNLPTELTLEVTNSSGEREALEWRILNARNFIEDWQWRLSVLQQLLPLPELKWRWKEALTILRAAPSKLLNLCMQKAKYDIGEEAVHRFSLSYEDRATLALAEWVDDTFKRASVEDVVSRATDETVTLQEIDFSSLQSQIGPIAAILLCIDVAAASAKSKDMSERLLDQAQTMLSEIYPGGSLKIGWDQIQEIALVSVARHLLKRLREFLEEENSATLQSILSGEMNITFSHQQGHRDRALALLHQMIEDAHMGKRQFLSGKLHNLARAVADEEIGIDLVKVEGREQKYLLDIDRNNFLGLGLRSTKQPSSSSAQPSAYDMKDAEKRLFSPLSAKPSTYLSQFVLHIAAIGDIVDGTDTTHDFNYFSLVYEWPKDLVTRLVFERGSTEAAEKVAEIMSADFVHEVISACVPSVYPSRCGHGWACLPLAASSAKFSHASHLTTSSGRGTCASDVSSSLASAGIAQYHLQLDIIKHLVKISPVRAVLACVFGSSMLYSSNESSFHSPLNEELPHSPDTNHMFYEFAVDQSERFPTLNRWIQLQTNLHRVSVISETPKDADDASGIQSNRKFSVKRSRELDTDTESDIDESIGSNTAAFAPEIAQATVDRDTLQDSMHQAAEDDATTFLTFDWENEEPYERTVKRLIEEKNIMDALSFSDRCLRGGASDELLRLLIEHEENSQNSGSSQGHVGNRMLSDSWQYCLRLKDKQLAAQLALRFLHSWELDAALDVLTMCSCHLPQSEPIKNEVLQRKQALQKYKHILSADDQYRSWQEVEAACKDDPEGLALKLAEKGAVSAALEVAESAGLSIDLRRELQGRQLVKLLTADPLSGGGPAEASRFLSSLRDSNDALPVAMGAMQLLPNLRSKQLLVHFFLKRKDSNLSDAEVSRLNSWALGLRVLSALPLPWQQRCSSLHEHPQLILEVLLMRKQLQSASLILKEFPSLRDDNVILKYGTKAIAVSISSPPRETRISVSGSRLKQKTKTATPTKSSLTSSFSNLQKEARRAFSSWTPRGSADKVPPKEPHKKRKSSVLTPSEKVAWETMTGIQEDHASSLTADGQDRLPSVSIAEEWMLTGDPKKDDGVRSSHRYDSAPDIILFKALLSLCSDGTISAKGAIDLCVNQMKCVLSSQQLPENASVEIIGQAYHATETFVEGLLYARSLLKKLVGSSDLPGNSERSKDADDGSSEAGSSSAGNQITDELSELLSQADAWLRHAELLQSLLGSGIAVSLDDIADQESSACLRDRLIGEERYSMAVYTCKKCKIDLFPVWIAWGHALLRMEHYSQARVKFIQALQLRKIDPDFHVAPVILDIINTIEGGPPVDVSAVRSMYEHLAKSAPTILDDSLSADSYLNVLHMPSTFPRSERSRGSQEPENSSSMSGTDYDDGPRSNLDNIRYLECVNYLQDYARQDLLDFMFRHGHYNDACLLFFPPDGVPLPPQPSSVGTVTSSSSPQRPDSVVTDYGTIDSLCEFCINYGAMSVLEEVISARISSSASLDSAVNKYTEMALAKICNYCETHKHFNYLYKFLVIKRDHVAAGLCCIQLFMNSLSQEDAVKHLQNAKVHFDDGITARRETAKLVGKGIRGKSASEKLTEEGLNKLSARAAIQVEVVKCLNETEGPQWKHSVFGNPNDPETFRRRCQIAETLAEKNFDLAYQVVCQFDLPAVDIYAAVAASLAERKKGNLLTEFLRNIKGNIFDDEWDEVLGTAINVYANKHKERPDRLIDMLISTHRKVLACVVCGRLKGAFQIASRSGSVADVQYVAHQALHANALPVLDLCKQWLAQYM
ncbi:uncharacterized protein LOC110712151 isoform X1 [Chenopodium quinoa]|uniref:uncharacterized protein LOC110712151 isoform X1 n=1 Tax=Chenopodium quinoa TaxID=63459 RepID=UPI000B7733AC|nr:uncharacterized protein LOC110712151 isoform X1 [Chenopodium quinoa]